MNDTCAAAVRRVWPPALPKRAGKNRPPRAAANPLQHPPQSPNKLGGPFADASLLTISTLTPTPVVIYLLQDERLPGGLLRLRSPPPARLVAARASILADLRPETLAACRRSKAPELFGSPSISG